MNRRTECALLIAWPIIAVLLALAQLWGIPWLMRDVQDHDYGSYRCYWWVGPYNLTVMVLLPIGNLLHIGAAFAAMGACLSERRDP
jgi:hypothetical protein